MRYDKRPGPRWVPAVCRASWGVLLSPSGGAFVEDTPTNTRAVRDTRRLLAVVSGGLTAPDADRLGQTNLKVKTKNGDSGSTLRQSRMGPQKFVSHTSLSRFSSSSSISLHEADPSVVHQYVDSASFGEHVDHDLPDRHAVGNVQASNGDRQRFALRRLQKLVVDARVTHGRIHVVPHVARRPKRCEIQSDGSETPDARQDGSIGSAAGCQDSQVWRLVGGAARGYAGPTDRGCAVLRDRRAPAEHKGASLA